MTGTAATEADEFAEIYKLVVVEILDYLPIARLDEDDEVYRTGDEKMRAVVREIEFANAQMQPMLVGTTSIGKIGSARRSDGAARLQKDRLHQA